MPVVDKTRIALLSDIHGNLVALDAVLADIQAQGDVDSYLILGDLVAIGAQPVAVLERVTALANVQFTRGNTDRYTTTLDRPPPTRADVAADPSLLPVFADLAHTFTWTRGCVSATGWFAFLATLSLEIRIELPDGTRLLGVHAAPSTDDGEGVHPLTSEADLQAMVAASAADLLCVGHTHWPMNLLAGDTRIVNLGSVSNHHTPELAAYYVLIEADRSGYRVIHRRVTYDRAAAIEAVRAAQHPAEEYLISYLDGRRVRQHWGEPRVQFEE